MIKFKYVTMSNPTRYSLCKSSVPCKLLKKTSDPLIDLESSKTCACNGSEVTNWQNVKW